MGRLPSAFAKSLRTSADVAARAAADNPGKVRKPTVPVAQLRAQGWRPNWQQAKNFSPMEENAPHVGLLAKVGEAIGKRATLGSYHTGISIGSNRGYPDLNIWGPGGIIWRELKGSTGTLFVAQLEVILGIRAAGGDAAVWWPEDYHLGVIDNELDRIAGIQPTGIQPAGRTRVLRPGHRWCGCPMDADHTCETWGGPNYQPR